MKFIKFDTSSIRVPLEKKAISTLGKRDLEKRLMKNQQSIHILEDEVLKRNRMASETSGLKSDSQIYLLNIKLNELREDIVRIQDRIFTIDFENLVKEDLAEKKLEQLRIKANKLIDIENKTKANAAAYLCKTRDMAMSVKRDLEKAEICPYCGNFLRENFEADHIIPVSYGGLSLPQNMVYICRDCNRIKSDLTLLELCRKFPYKFNLIEIEARLLKKGKKF